MHDRFFLETANAKNVNIYIKKGFITYNKWMNNGIELFYMRKYSGVSLPKSSK